MAVSLQLLYPTDDATTFDHDDYATRHMAFVGEHMGPHMQSSLIVKGLAGGPDVPPAFHVIATLSFADKAALDAALGAAGPALADIPNFFNGQPTMLIGEAVA
tara:strand:+ start:7130 stop:7438 length:309 start_codon:yes stop_codon:yes gene_type:complete